MESGARETLPDYFPEWEEGGLDQARMDELSRQFAAIMAALLEILPERAVFTLGEVVDVIPAARDRNTGNFWIAGISTIFA